MNLSSADITNYRSIANVSLDFEQGCQVLVGINESGKSNILRALQLLDPAVQPTPSDVRIERQDEKPIEAASVRFTFTLDDDEAHEVYEELSKNPFFSADAPFVDKKGKPLTFREFCFDRKQGLHKIDIKDGSRTTTYCALPKNVYKLLPGWRKAKGEALKLTWTDPAIKSKPTDIAALQGVEKVIEELNSDPVTPEEVNDWIGNRIKALVNEKLPKCIYWKYTDQYLLPSSIDVDSFVSDPDSCVPLKSMFELAGYKTSDIGAIITTTRQQQPHRYINLLNRVSSAATEHLRTVWHDQKQLRIELKPNGNSIVPVIQDDQVALDMANRSDGFKRLVSFLLQISAKVKTSQLKGTLILVDEPEIALHPKGARNLMTELINIGHSNYVVYSTHSIFMIDRNCIERHLIVEKRNEVTSTSRAEKSRLQDEDVLFSAVGYSVFENLKEKNIIFEGWRDKEVFRVLREAIPKAETARRDELSTFGLTFAEGVKDVRNVAKFLELANRGCLVISDSDGAGIAAQKEYARTNGWGKWLTLNDIMPGGRFVSSEDLLERSAVVKRANQFRKSRQTLCEFTDAHFIVQASTVKSLEDWLRSDGLLGDELKQSMHELKNALFLKLKAEEIVSQANKLLTFVQQHNFSG